jgi:hypothetical protein
MPGLEPYLHKRNAVQEMKGHGYWGRSSGRPLGFAPEGKDGILDSGEQLVANREYKP